MESNERISAILGSPSIVGRSPSVTSLPEEEPKPISWHTPPVTTIIFQEYIARIYAEQDHARAKLAFPDGGVSAVQGRHTLPHDRRLLLITQARSTDADIGGPVHTEIKPFLSA